MIAVVVHTYFGSYGDYVQLAGIFDSLDKALKCQENLTNFFLRESNFDNPEKYLEFAKRQFIIDLLPVDINREYSISLEDDIDIFKETRYDTDMDPIYLGGHAE